jgi:hypothetical protein
MARAISVSLGSAWHSRGDSLRLPGAVTNGAMMLQSRSQKATTLQPLRCKDPLDAAIGLPAPHHPVDTRVVDFGAAFVIAFDWEHHPLTPHIERLQDVIEDLVQRQRRRRSASTTTQVRQDKFLELRFAQFRRNRLPAGVTVIRCVQKSGL